MFCSVLSASQHIPKEQQRAVGQKKKTSETLAELRKQSPGKVSTMCHYMCHRIACNYMVYQNLGNVKQHNNYSESIGRHFLLLLKTKVNNVILITNKSFTYLELFIFQYWKLIPIIVEFFLLIWTVYKWNHMYSLIMHSTYTWLSLFVIALLLTVAG